MTQTINRDKLNAEAGIRERDNDEDGAHCICCQRPMSDAQADKAEHLHLVEGGLAFGPTAFDGGAGDVGGHPVGSTCARKIRKALKQRGLAPSEWLERLG